MTDSQCMFQLAFFQSLQPHLEVAQQIELLNCHTDGLVAAMSIPSVTIEQLYLPRNAIGCG